MSEALVVGIVVSDLDAVDRFYRAIGFTLEDDVSFSSGTRIRTLRLGEDLLKLNAPTPPPAPAPLTASHRELAGLRYITVRIEDATTLRSTLLEEGFSADDIRETAAGTLFFARDPEGNFVEFVETTPS